MGAAKSLWSRLTSTDAQVEAEELRKSSESEGSVAACDCRAGDVVTVKGAVRSITMEPSGALPRLEATVFDGTGAVQLVWMGRRRIVGIEPGRRIRATGRVTGKHSTPVLYNPSYELLPAESA
jgi:RecG-like helicase